VIVLRLPHLVLADVGDDNGFAAGFLPKVVDDVSGVEMPVVGQTLNVKYSGIALEFGDVTNPCAVVAGYDVRRKLFKTSRASPTRAASTLTFLLISARSISM